MREIKIDSEMKRLWKNSVLGCIQCKVQVEESSKELLQEIDDFSKELQNTIQKVPDIPKREEHTEHLEKTRAVTVVLRKPCAAA